MFHPLHELGLYMRKEIKRVIDLHMYKEKEIERKKLEKKEIGRKKLEKERNWKKENNIYRTMDRELFPQLVVPMKASLVLV